MASEEHPGAFRKAGTEAMAGGKEGYQPMPWALAPRVPVRRSRADTINPTLSSQHLLSYDHSGPSYAQKPTENGKLPRTYVVLARKSENKDSDDKDLQNLIIVDSKLISDKIQLDLQQRGVKLENLVGSKSFQTFSQKNQEKLLQKIMPHSSRKDVSSYMTARARERGIRPPVPPKPREAGAYGGRTDTTYGAQGPMRGASPTRGATPMRGTSPMRERKHMAPAPTGTTQAHEATLTTVAEQMQHACNRTDALANRVTNNSRTDTLQTDTLKTETLRGTPTRTLSPQRHDPPRFGRIRREAFQSPTRNFTSRPDIYQNNIVEQTIDLQLGVPDPPAPSIPRPLGPAELPADQGVDISDWLQRSKTPKPRLTMPAPPPQTPSRGLPNDSYLRRPKNPTNRMASASRVMTAHKRSNATPFVESLGDQTNAVLPDHYGPSDAYKKCLDWVNSLPDDFGGNEVLDKESESS